MSRATRWIVVGTLLLFPAAILVFVGTVDEAPGLMFLGILTGVAGLFAAQVGVVALAVRIGVHELLVATRELAPPKPPVPQWPAEQQSR